MEKSRLNKVEVVTLGILLALVLALLGPTSLSTGTGLSLTRVMLEAWQPDMGSCSSCSYQKAEAQSSGKGGRLASLARESQARPPLTRLRVSLWAGPWAWGLPLATKPARSRREAAPVRRQGRQEPGGGAVAWLLGGAGAPSMVTHSKDTLKHRKSTQRVPATATT